jgi:hypothetical protein
VVLPPPRPQVASLEAELAGKDKQVALLMEAQHQGSGRGSNNGRGSGDGSSQTLAELTQQVGRWGWLAAGY